MIYTPETEKAPAVFYPPQLTALAQKLPSRELLEDWCGAVPNSAFIGATDEEIADMARVLFFVLCPCLIFTEAVMTQQNEKILEKLKNYWRWPNQITRTRSRCGITAGT